MQRLPTDGDNPVQGSLVGAAGVLLVALALGPFRETVSPALPAILLLAVVVAAGGYGGRGVGASIGVIGAAIELSVFVTVRASVMGVIEAFVLTAVFVAVGVGAGWLAQFTERTEDEVEIVTGDRKALSDRLVSVSVERTLLAEEAEDLAEREVHRVALLRSVSHDLRTPLSAIRAVATDLRDGVHYDTEVRTDLLATMCDEVERLDQMVANLLSMSRIEAGRLEPHPQVFDVSELVTERVRSLNALFHHLVVRRSVDVDLPLAHGDYVMVQEVLTNLLGNAARHAPEGTELWVVAEKVVEEPPLFDGDANRRFVQIEVSDHGPGVADEFLPKLFEPFTRGEGSRSTGLGLAIAKAMVEAHGGRIWCTRTFGGGATFCFTIPVYDDAGDEVEMPMAEQDDEPGAAGAAERDAAMDGIDVTGPAEVPT